MVCKLVLAVRGCRSLCVVHLRVLRGDCCALCTVCGDGASWCYCCRLVLSVGVVCLFFCLVLLVIRCVLLLLVVVVCCCLVLCDVVCRLLLLVCVVCRCHCSPLFAVVAHCYCLSVDASCMRRCGSC